MFWVNQTCGFHSATIFSGDVRRLEAHFQGGGVAESSRLVWTIETLLSADLGEAEGATHRTVMCQTDYRENECQV